MVPRKTLVSNQGTEVLDKWVSEDGDLEIYLTFYEGRYSVTTMLVEVPEEGEEIPAGEEMVESLGSLLTESKERAYERFLQAVSEARP